MHDPWKSLVVWHQLQYPELPLLQPDVFWEFLGEVSQPLGTVTIRGWYIKAIKAKLDPYERPLSKQASSVPAGGVASSPARPGTRRT